MGTITVQRHEEKYLLNPMQAYELEMLLGGLLHRDDHGTDGTYYIRSLYFDTPDDVDYVDKVLGVSRRQKVRLRLYDTAAHSVKLEIKNKEGQWSFKQSVTLNRAQAQCLLADDYASLAEHESETAHRAYTFFKKEYRKPAMLIDYERTAFSAPFAELRITLDRNIRAAKSDDLFGTTVPMVGLHSDGVAVLEVKYDGFLPRYLQGVLSSVQPQKLSVSKYAMSREILY